MKLAKKCSLADLIIVLYIFAAVVTAEGSIIMKAMRVLLFGITFGIILKKKKIIFDIYVKWLIAFLFFAGCSVFWAVNKSYASNMAQTLLINALCMYSLWYLIQRKSDRLDLVLKCLVWFPLALEIQVIINGGIFAFINSRNAGGINGNTVGICAAFGACFALFYFTKKKKIIYIFMTCINIVILILSSSRKAILCFAIPLVFIYLYQQKKNTQKKILKIISIVIVAMIGCYLLFNIPILYDTVGNRILSLISGLTGHKTVMDASAKTRMNLIFWGIEWFKKKIWIGYGIDNYRVVLHMYHSDYPLSFYAHNNYVELLVDVGVIGFSLYYFLYVLCFIKGFLQRKSLSKCQVLFIGVLLTLVINEYGLVSYYDKYVQILILLSWITINNKKMDI